MQQSTMMPVTTIVARSSDLPHWASAGWLVPCALMMATLGSLSIDCQIAQWLESHKFPGFFRDLLFHGELFGHAWGLLLVLVLIYQFDSPRRAAIPQVLACTLGAGMTANLCKLLIARARPNHFDFQGGVFATFGDWLPFLDSGSSGQSFPSAHTAGAVGLALALAVLYPTARRLLWGLAVLTACNRLCVGAHYLSDVFCGALTGLLVARCCLTGRLSAYFPQVAPQTLATEQYLAARDHAREDEPSVAVANQDCQAA